MTDDSASRAARNVSNMTGGRLATQAVLLVSAFVIPRVLGLETFGLYAALMAVVAMLDAVATGGLQMAEIRYFAPIWRSGDRQRALELGSSIWLSRLALSGLAGLIAVAWLAGVGALEIELKLAVLTGLVVATRAALEATRHLFLSIGQVGRMAVFELLRALLTLLLVVVVFEWSGDLTGVFATLPIGYLLLLATAAWLLLRVLPLRVGLYNWAELRPLLGFSGLTLIGSIAWAAQAQFATYAIASWVSLGEGALVALTVQIYVLFQSLVVAVRSSLLPILAEIEAAGQSERLRAWGSRMMRWGTALATVSALGWAFGGELLLQLLPNEFAPVYRSGALMMIGVIAMTAAAACNGLLYMTGNAGWASANRIVFALITVGGVLVLLPLDDGATAFRVAGVYAAAAVGFFVASYASLVRRRAMRLPLRRTAMLIAPVAVTWPVLSWGANAGLKLLALGVVLGAYLAYVFALGLISREEVAEARTAMRRSPTSRPSDS